MSLLQSKSGARWRRGFTISLMSLLICLSLATSVKAMCGAFVATSVAELTNTTSRVVIAHQGNKSIFTMENDFQGNVQEFARIVPMPVLPTREQVRIGDNQIIEQLDQFTAPRLARYAYDFDRLWQQEISDYMPILWGVLAFGWLIWRLWRRISWQRILMEFLLLGLLTMILLPVFFLNQLGKGSSAPSGNGSPVQIADQFTVGEYDVTLLNAAESNSLTEWLKQNGYKLPNGAEPMLKSYIQAGMKFFVVKINLAKAQQAKPGFLRPIVVEYDSPQFMLPIRLSTLNAKADQDLTVYILAPEQVAEVANYPTEAVPTDVQSQRRELSGKELPTWIPAHFDEFYAATFQKAYEQAGRSAAFLEYAGAIALRACEPCTMESTRFASFTQKLPQTGIFWPVEKTYVTRLHVRYNATTFPKDLEFRMMPVDEMRSRLQTVGKLIDRNSGSLFQARYVIRPASGSPMGMSGLKYWWNDRKTADNLAQLTGWTPAEIEQKSKSPN